jgi:hypothetical protein
MAEDARRVVAFDLYGTLVDPIGIAAEVDRVVSGGRGENLATHMWCCVVASDRHADRTPPRGRVTE